MTKAIMYWYVYLYQNICPEKRFELDKTFIQTYGTTQSILDELKDYSLF